MLNFLSSPQFFSLTRWLLTIAGTSFGVPALQNGDTQTALLGGVSAVAAIIWSWRDSSKTVIVERAVAILEKEPVYDPSGGGR